MSNSMNFQLRKNSKIKRTQIKKSEISPINPDILSYIKKLQNDNEKARLYGNKKTTREIIRNVKQKNTVDNKVLNDDITSDKEQRFAAKKGLLYLLNKLSNGTFCPDIEDYFLKLKEAKIEELKNKSSKLNENNMMEGEESDIEEKIVEQKNKKFNEPSLKRLLSEQKKEEVENQNYFKKQEEDKIDKLDIKKYENDYDVEDLLKFYDKKDIKDNTFQINYNKEKLIKMKFKKENKANEFKFSS